MKSSLKYLNDEHMRLYEWSGLGAQTSGPHPARSQRSHAWHASCSILGVLTSLLILNGCNKQGTAEPASTQAAQEMKEAPAEAAAPAAEKSPEQATEQAGQPGDQAKP